MTGVDTLMQFEDFVSERTELLYVELISSIFCIVCNVYFAFRFSAVSQFNPNLRTVMVTFQLFTATIAFLHPVLRFIPESWYSVKDGRYVGAFIYYLVQFYVQVCLFIMCSKFAIFGLERRFAVKHRVNYEFQDGRKVKRLLALFIFVLSAFLFIKSAFIFYFDDLMDDLKSRLERAVLVDKFPPVLIALHLFGALSWMYGLYEFVRLSRHLKHHWYSGKTLSESYQIKQSGAVVKVLKPIVIAFLVMFLTNLTLTFLAIYLYYFRGFNANSPLFVTLMNIEYTGAAFYNLFATSYMLWYFKPVRKLMLQDLANICLIDVRTTAIASSTIDWEKEREDHFQYLNTYWNQIPTPKRSLARQ